MRVNKATGGFTLLELMITILVGSIITLATTTILLLGLRLHNESNATVEKQNTTRILLATLENLATEGMIKDIVWSGTDDKLSWQIIGQNEDNIIFTYDSKNEIIYTGSATTGVPLLEDVLASTVSLNDKKVLTISLQMEDGSYSSSVYCRTAPPVSNEEKDEIFEELEKNEIYIRDEEDGSKTSKARMEFLKILASQYGSNGVIMDPDSTTLTYYSQWYIGNSNWGVGDSAETWNASTPWCACFVSWALAEAKQNGYIEKIPCESHVQKYVEYLKKPENAVWKEKTVIPIPGDLVIFDWEGGSDPDHVGVVLNVDNETIYTIEGNTSNVVAVRAYKIGSPEIVGYGALEWTENP